MNRREALRQTALAAGAAALWASLPARTWAALAAPAGWSATDEALLTLIGDTIIQTQLLVVFFMSIQIKTLTK